jgi:hypothetical protein
MRNHRKVKALRNKFGLIKGYAFWAMFIEYLTELDGNEFEYSDAECEMFAGELGVSATEIKEMIDYCIFIELLFKTDQNFIYSDSLNDNLNPVYEKRKRERVKSKAKIRRENGSFGKQLTNDGVSANDNTTNSGESVEEIPQSIIDKSIIDKISFDEFWNLYDKKVTKMQTIKKWNSLSLETQKLIMEYIPKYKESKPEIQFRRDPIRFLTKETWKDEIIFNNKQSFKPQNLQYGK